jgi:hypothetical protein
MWKIIWNCLAFKKVFRCAPNRVVVFELGFYVDPLCFRCVTRGGSKGRALALPSYESDLFIKLVLLALNLY